MQQTQLPQRIRAQQHLATSCDKPMSTAKQLLAVFREHQGSPFDQHVKFAWDMPGQAM
jgi:hypothetical protein